MLIGVVVGFLLVGVIEFLGWNNVFYMLIGLDIMVLLVSFYILYYREYIKYRRILSFYKFIYYTVLVIRYDWLLGGLEIWIFFL